jgi:hypothetical protein
VTPLNPDETLIFDLATQHFDNPLYKLLVVLSVATFGAFIVVWSRLSVAMKVPAALFVGALVVVSAAEYIHFTRRHPVLMEDVRNQQFSEIEGIVSRTRRDGNFVYRVGDQVIDVSSRRYPAFDADDEWMAEHLVGRCARVRMNSDGDILWLAVRDQGCASEIAPGP